jgi:PadR family transcriptional regulator PadR
LVGDRATEGSGSLQEEAGDFREFIDRIVKANRDVIVLSVIAETPMCGYDLIKEIFERYNVFLSQGTIYPILYSLEEEGILRAEYGKGNMRTKIYSITSQGRHIVDKKFDDFINAMEHINSIFKR